MNSTLELSIPASLLFIFSINLSEYLRNSKKPHLIYGSEASEKLIESCSLLKKTFYPCPFVWGAHTSLIPFILKGIWQKSIMPRIEWQSEVCILPDGQSLLLDWAKSRHKNAESGLEESSSDTPIVMIHHGAFCNSKDIPGQDYIEEAHRRGWMVCVLNRRGHGGKICTLTQPQWNFFGSTKDVKYITLNIIRKRRPNARFFMIGLSAGSGLLARFFGEESGIFLGGAGICPGYNIEACMGRFNFPYQDLLLYLGKRYFLYRHKKLLENLPGYHECAKAENLQDWLDHSYAMAGYSSKKDYYDAHNPMRTVSQISDPCLFINSEDDPLCVIDNVYDHIFDMKNSKSCIVAVTKTGSHLAFFEGFSMRNWAEVCTYEFFDAILSKKNNIDENNTRYPA